MHSLFKLVLNLNVSNFFSGKKRRDLGKITNLKLDSSQEKLEQIPLDEYKNAITYLAKDKSDFLFPNSGPGHAAIVISTIIDYSEKVIRIYDEKLNGDLNEFSDDLSKYNSLISSALIRSINEGKKVLIVIRDNSNVEVSSYRELLQYAKEKPDQVKIKRSNSKFQTGIKLLFNEDINFAVGDTKAFRIELSAKGENDKIDRKAMCSFNRPKYAKSLAKTFDKYFKFLPEAF